MSKVVRGERQMSKGPEIRLSVEPYCHTCPEFEAESKKRGYWCAYGMPAQVDDAFVTCKHRGKCSRIAEYLKKQPAQGA